MIRIAVDMNLREDNRTIVIPSKNIPVAGLTVGARVVLYEPENIECEAIVRRGETWEWVADSSKALSSPLRCEGDGTFTYAYDIENRLVSANGAGNAATYTYDGRDRRLSKTVNGSTTIFVTAADDREVLEYDGASGAILRWYAYGLGANNVLDQVNVPAATRTTFVPDIQGSLIGSLDAATGTLSKRGYLPYGASVNTTGTLQP